MAFEELAEVLQRWVGDDVDDHAAAGEVDADRQAIREVPDPPVLSVADRDVRQLRLGNPGQRQDVRRLLVGGPEPDQIRVLDDRVEHHQPLDGVVQRDGFAQAAVGLADGRVQRPLVDVVDPRSVMPTVVHRRVLEPHELSEELPRLGAVDDAAEARVLARDADASVEHHRRQKPRLTLGEALLGDGLDAFIECHLSSSSTTLGVLPPPRPLRPCVEK
jgi:hypothetical protein